MQELEFGSDGKPPTVVQTVTRRWIEQHSQGMRVTAEERTVVRSRRNIKATPWGRYDGSEPLRVRQTGVVHDRQAAEAAEERARLEVDLLRQLLSADDAFTRANAKELLYLQYTLDALEKVTPETFSNSVLWPLTVEQASQLLHVYQQSPNGIPEIIKRLADEDIDLIEDEQVADVEDDPQLIPNDGSILEEDSNMLELEKKLNAEQKLILDILTKTVRHRSPTASVNVDPLVSKQAFLFAHGAAGTGKTFMARAIVQKVKSLGLDTYCIAPTGSASGNLPEGRTIHNGLCIAVDQKTDFFCSPLLVDQLCKLQKRLKQSTAAVVIIDEISCVTAAMLAYIDQRLQQMMGCYDLPFGGLSVLIMGDFFQLPPVNGEPIYKDLIAHTLRQKEVPAGKSQSTPDPHKPNYAGTLLFQRFQLIELNQQMRAAEDVEHTEMLNQMRYPTEGGRRIPSDITTRFQVLSKADVESDPSWITAPIIVKNNMERHNINKFQSMVFARQQKQPRFSWRSELANRTTLDKDGTPKNASDTLDEFYYKNHPILTNYFVKGAPGYLIENINPSIGLANGTKIVYEAIVLDDRDEPTKISELLTTEISPDITLKHPPLFVIVSVPGADPSRFEHMTLVRNKVVIPIKICGRSKELIVKISRKKGEPPLKVYYKPHNAELGFSVTVNKIQGKTVDKIIIDLNYRPWRQQFDFHSLMVAISRVRSSKNIRVLQQQPGNVNFDYLLQLEPNAKLLVWLKGYECPTPGKAAKWSIQKAQTALNLFSNPPAKPKRAKRTTKSAAVRVLQTFAEFQQSQKP